MPRYALKSPDLRTALYQHDRVAECRHVAEVRARQFPDERTGVIVRSSDCWIDSLDGYGFRAPSWLRIVELEQLRADELQREIQADPDAVARLFAWCDARGIEHGDRVTGEVLAAVAGRDDRTFRRWVSNFERFGVGARRAIIAAAFCEPVG